LCFKSINFSLLFFQKLADQEARVSTVRDRNSPTEKSQAKTQSFSAKVILLCRFALSLFFLPLLFSRCRCLSIEVPTPPSFSLPTRSRNISSSQLNYRKMNSLKNSATSFASRKLNSRQTKKYQTTAALSRDNLLFSNFAGIGSELKSVFFLSNRFPAQLMLVNLKSTKLVHVFLKF
jgi:hypothetical protein